MFSDNSFYQIFRQVLKIEVKYRFNIYRRSDFWFIKGLKVTFQRSLLVEKVVPGK